MRVRKTFRFYAAHRNEEIGGKCASIHGHRYGLSVEVMEPMSGSVSILFEDLERRVAPLIEDLDHSLLLHEGDPARDALLASGACHRVYLVPFPTSAENMARHLFDALRAAGLNVTELILQETDSSSIVVRP